MVLFHSYLSLFCLLLRPVIGGMSFTLEPGRIF